MREREREAERRHEREQGEIKKQRERKANRDRKQREKEEERRTAVVVKSVGAGLRPIAPLSTAGANIKAARSQRWWRRRHTLQGIQHTANSPQPHTASHCRQFPAYFSTTATGSFQRGCNVWTQETYYNNYYSHYAHYEGLNDWQYLE